MLTSPSRFTSPPERRAPEPAPRVRTGSYERTRRGTRSRTRAGGSAHPSGEPQGLEFSIGRPRHPRTARRRSEFGPRDLACCGHRLATARRQHARARPGRAPGSFSNQGRYSPKVTVRKVHSHRFGWECQSPRDAAKRASSRRGSGSSKRRAPGTMPVLHAVAEWPLFLRIPAVPGDGFEWSQSSFRGVPTAP